METTTQRTGNKPAAKILVRIQASIWENASEKGPYYTVSFDRHYQDTEGNWKSSQSFKVDDRLVLAKAADKAHDETLGLRHEKAVA